jgi:uncharacterized protein (TIGR02246 family)
MSKQGGFAIRLALLGAAGVAIGFAIDGGRAGTAGPPAALPAPGAPGAARAAAPGERPDDRGAVRKALDGFAAAFRKGDAKALAAHWAAEGEYVGEDGATFRGRAELEKAYAEFFAKNPDNTLAVEVESVRFPSRDTAVVEGYFKVHRGKKRELVVSRCSFLYAREDGKWLIAIAREWPGDGLSLRDMEWLIGTWEAKRNGTVVTTKYEWAGNKSFIRCQFSVAQDGKTVGGTQMIGKDPATGLLRVWTFEDEGGIGEAEVTRDGKKWVHAARGATADGRELTATNVLTPVDNDSFLWQVVGRTLDGEELPDLPPVKVTRVQAKP